jgi:hypothetical protein
MINVTDVVFGPGLTARPGALECRRAAQAAKPGLFAGLG